MDENIKADWATNLREAGLKQGRLRLYSKENDSFCCLGVLCEMARAEGVVTLKDGTYISKNSKRCQTYLPKSVQEWAGLTNRNPLPSGHDLTLARLNDHGKTFPEIADIIEKGI